MNGIRVAVWLFLGVLALGTVPSRAEAQGDSDLLTLSAGIFDFGREEFRAGEFRLEYRMGDPILWFVKPMAGMMTTTEGSFYGYGGFGIDLYFGRAKSIVITPSFNVGYYAYGDGKDLGNEIEFRSGIEAAYRFKNHSRVGFAIQHMSNAGLGEKNPGEESMIFTYSHPVNFFGN